jgi:hypothetical protein
LQRLAEPQGHAVAFTDAIIRPAVKPRIVRLAERGSAPHRRQGPNAEWMVAGVGWIGVDFRPANKLETCLLGERDDEVFTDIAGCRGRILRLGDIQPVLFDAQNATRLQHRVEIRKRLLGPALRHPIVHIPEGQHRIDSARRGNRT